MCLCPVKLYRKFNFSPTSGPINTRNTCHVASQHRSYKHADRIMSVFSERLSTVLVIGDDGGVGLLVAARLVDLGHTVILVNRNQDTLHHAIKDCPELIFVQANISTDTGCKQLYHQMVSKYAEVNVLIDFSPVKGESLPDAHSPSNLKWSLSSDLNVLAANIFPAMHLNIIFLSHLLRQTHGCIVNVIPPAAVDPTKYSEPLKDVTNAVLHAFTKCLRHQVSDHPHMSVIEVTLPLLSIEDTNCIQDTTARDWKDVLAQHIMCELLTGKKKEVEITVEQLLKTEV